MAFGRIKQQQESKINVLVDQKVDELVNKSNLERDNTIQTLQQNLNSLQKDLQDIKEFELARFKDPDYGRKKFNQEILDEMKRTGKDLKTVLSERLDTDAMISHFKNDKTLPRIHRELLIEDLISMKQMVELKNIVTQLDDFRRICSGFL